jgi:hypothetical protein
MSALTAAGAAAVQLEKVQDVLIYLVEMEGTLDKMLQDNGRAERVSTRNYRIPMVTQIPGAVSKINLDDAVTGLPAGDATNVDVGTLTPLAICVPLQWTKLTELVGSKDVAVANMVDKTIADATKSLRRFRDIFLQTDGTGKLATVDAGYAGGGANPIVLSGTPFGARLLARGQKVGVFNGNALRGSCTILKVGKFIGSTQTITVDAVPAGTVAGDFIRVDGVENGAPVFINGLPVFHQTSGAGTTLGIDRSNEYVVANGVDAGGGQISQILLRLIFTQIRNRLGDEALEGIFFHTHPSQVSAYEELGFGLQTIPLNGGKADGMDLLFRGKKEVDGKAIVENIHADQTRWDAMQSKCWGKIKWGNPPFWYRALDGERIFPIYAANGSPTTGVRAFLVDAYQNYCDNMAGVGAITTCKVPAKN